jgi:hypothetical protein
VGKGFTAVATALKIFILLIALTPLIARAQLTIPTVAEERDATLPDLQQEANRLIDNVITYTGKRDSQGLSSTFDDGVTYLMAQRNSIMSNLAPLAASVGPRIKQAAAASSWGEWNFLGRNVFSWATASGQSALVASATTVARSLGGNWPMEYGPESGSHSAPATSEANAAVASSTSSTDTTGSAGGSNSTSSTTNSLSDSSRGIASVPAGISDDSSAFGKKKASAATELALNEFTKSSGPKGELNTEEFLDLKVVKCFKLPGKIEVGCAPKVAQLCFNSQNRELPCP